MSRPVVHVAPWEPTQAEKDLALIVPYLMKLSAAYFAARPIRADLLRAALDPARSDLTGPELALDTALLKLLCDSRVHDVIHRYLDGADE